MTVPPAAQTSYAPPPPNQPTSKKPWVKWVALGCVAAVLIAVAIFAAIWFTVKKATAGPETVVREFLTATAAGDYAAAHNLFSAPLKEVQGQSEFEEMARQNANLFAITDISFSNRSIDTNGAEFSGNVTLESGTVMPAQFRLVRENGDWKLIAWNIGS